MPDIQVYPQYTNATKFKTLMNAIIRDSWLNFEDFFNLKFNLLTCDHEGLEWWGNQHILDMQQYITIPKYRRNITTNYFSGADTPFWVLCKTPNNFNNGNWYNNQVVLKYFRDEEYRQILLNKFKKTYYSCTLGNLFIFLNKFFQYYNFVDDKDHIIDNQEAEYRKTIKFRIEVTRRINDKGTPTTSFWTLYHDKPFSVDYPDKNEMWVELFNKKSNDGDSLILPIPMNVEWKMIQG